MPDLAPTSDQWGHELPKPEKPEIEDSISKRLSPIDAFGHENLGKHILDLAEAYNKTGNEEILDTILRYSKHIGVSLRTIQDRLKRRQQAQKLEQADIFNKIPQRKGQEINDDYGPIDRAGYRYRVDGYILDRPFKEAADLKDDLEYKGFNARMTRTAQFAAHNMRAEIVYAIPGIMGMDWNLDRSLEKLASINNGTFLGAGSGFGGRDLSFGFTDKQTADKFLSIARKVVHDNGKQVLSANVIDDGIWADPELHVGKKKAQESWEETRCPHCGTPWDQSTTTEDEDDNGNVGVFPACSKCGNRISDIALHWPEEEPPPWAGKHAQTVKMPLKSFEKEHKNLVKVLQQKNPKALNKEKVEQSNELKSVEKKYSQLLPSMNPPAQVTYSTQDPQMQAPPSKPTVPPPPGKKYILDKMTNTWVAVPVDQTVQASKKTSAVPTFKSPDINQHLSDIMGRDREQTIRQNLCMKCGGPATEFRDPLSEKEYAISGLCQNCQDTEFGPEGSDL